MTRWYAVHTHVGGEAKAAFHLRRQGFGVYLPRYLKRRRHARRTDWVPAPLFPRYLFVGMDVARARWRAVHSTVGVSYLVCQGDAPLPVPDAVIDEIRAHEDERDMVVIGRKIPFARGDRVRIVDGPLADQVGLFDAITDAERVVLLLDLLGRQVEVRVPVEAVGTLA
ncbi:MAG: transcriptional activator RfaH [Hyphomicrobiales bacterium]|nr:transcriptional activator RfaH [Hyphomicrobiales bacterium]